MERLGKKKFKIPYTMTLLFGLMLICAILTYVAPTGKYDYITNSDGVSVIDPNSYHTVERNPTSPMDFMLAVPKGIQRQVTIFCMILCTLGGVQILNESKAIDAGILAIIRKHRKAELPAIIGLSILYGVIGLTAGWTIEFTPFVPITISVVRAMGYDDLLGASIVILPGACGWTSGVINIYSTALAQSFAGLPIFSGLWLRLISFFIFMAIAMVFIIAYSRKYKRENPGAGDLDSPEIMALEFNLRRKLMLIWNGFALIYMAYGTTLSGWGMNHVSGWWIIVVIVSGFIMNMGLSDTFQSFIRGLQSIVGPAFNIGFAAGILIILQEGNLLDSTVHGLSNLLASAPKPLVGVMVMLVTMVFEVFIASVQGKVVTIIPLLAPLAETIGINRQVIVLAFIFGDGFPNWIYPTAAVCVAALGAGKIQWGRWAKFIWKPMLALHVAAALIVAIAQMINYT